MRDGLGEQALIPLPALCRRLLLAGLLAGGIMAGGRLDAQPSPEGFAPGAGVAVVQTHCTVCHPATMIVTRHFSAQKWGDIVDQMIGKGAQVSDTDYDIIVAYLAKNYGAER